MYTYTFCMVIYLCTHVHICPIRLADKSWLKILLADLLWEKNIVRWLKKIQLISQTNRTIYSIFMYAVKFSHWDGDIGPAAAGIPFLFWGSHTRRTREERGWPNNVVQTRCVRLMTSRSPGRWSRTAGERRSFVSRRTVVQSRKSREMEPIDGSACNKHEYSCQCDLTLCRSGTTKPSKSHFIIIGHFKGYNIRFYSWEVVVNLDNGPWLKWLSRFF